MRLIVTGQLDARRFVTHRFGMHDFERAYDVFGDPASGALKVVLTREDEDHKDEDEGD